MTAGRKRRRERKRDRHRIATTPASEFLGVREARLLTYTRQQAAEALGVSISTIDRRVVPSIQTVKTPWGQRLIPVSELERFVQDHLETARRATRRPVGRPRILPTTTVQRIRREFSAGRSLGEIARRLNDDDVPTAHGGQQWWPSTVRSVLLRASH
ncbi:MAG: recombinase family protein [Gaiellaceae bacterium MAG52_C11]|nr:recombinase family protein [Candidatus Gaiellasilicea maunaloa]